MSHIVTIQTKLNDPTAVTAACQRLSLAAPVEGKARLYSGEGTGLLVQLPEWRYPLVIDTASGTLSFDNFTGHWGDQHYLDRFLQCYAVEKAKLEARKRGYQVTEHALQDGSIRLNIIEGS